MIPRRDPDFDLRRDLPRRLFRFAGRSYAIERHGAAFTVTHLASGRLVAAGRVDGPDATLEHLAHEGAELEFEDALTPALEQLVGPAPGSVPASLEEQLRQRAQLLAAAGHRVLGLTREISAEIRSDQHAGALADLGLLRRQLLELSEQVEELDTQMGAIVHNECITCASPRQEGALQCAECTATPAPGAEAGELVLLHSESPRWDSWRRS